MRTHCVSRRHSAQERLSCPMLLRGYLSAFGLSAALALACWQSSDSDKGRGAAQRLFPEPPDVILVVIDALRRDHVGVYGYPRPTTPFLDELAAEGVVFENAYSQAPQTFNSTTTLLSSRYFPYLVRNTRFQSVPGLNEKGQARHAQVPYLAQANLTLPEALRQGGYETLGVFTNPHHHATSGFWQGFETAQYLTPNSRATAYAPGPKIHRAFFQWLDQRPSDRPYFAYLHFMDVHAPYRPPHKLRKLFVRVRGKDRYMKGKPTGDQIPSAEDLAYMQALYDGEIRFVDEVLRALVTELSRRNAWQNTLLIVTSDHGDEFMDHGGLGHGTTMEKELLRIPLIFAGAGLKQLGPQHRRPSPPVRNLDLAPTILEIARVPIPPEFEGTSLVPLLTGGDGASRHPGTTFAWIGPLRSLNDGDWHFIWDRESGERTLYDERTDPKGLTSIAAQRPDVVAELSAGISKLEQLHQQTQQAMEEHARQSDADSTPPEVDPEILEQLKALGYL